jgi:hypothetical protein
MAGFNAAIKKPPEGGGVVRLDSGISRHYAQINHGPPRQGG